MQNPRTKYPLIFFLWAILFCVGIMILRVSLNHTTFVPAWIRGKLAQKQSDTAIKRLNMSMPTDAMHQQLLAANNAPHIALNTTGLSDYYTQLVETMPWMADGYTCLGFIYYHDGKRDRAFDMFQKAFYINPDYFYNHLNLGLMYLEAHRIDAAIEIFTAALSKDPRKTLTVIASSKIYTDILTANKNYNPLTDLLHQYTALSTFVQVLKNNPDANPRAVDLHIKIL